MVRRVTAGANTGGTKMERFSAAIGLALSVLSVGGAFDTFTSVGLLPKLIVAALAAALIIFSAASWLAKHIRPAQENVGFGLPQEGRSKLRGGPVFRNRMAAWLRWILGWIMPPISPRLPA